MYIKGTRHDPQHHPSTYMTLMLSNSSCTCRRCQQNRFKNQTKQESVVKVTTLLAYNTGSI